MAPAITTLLDRVEGHLSKLERREQALIAKSELQEGRLSQGVGAEKKKKTTGMGGSRFGAGAADGDKGLERQLRLKALKGKKERLGYAVERLTLQQQQKQRQLRMSVNVSAAAP